MPNDKNNRGITSLEDELNWWKGQEQKFKGLFSSAALKDKAFLKMKLEHYDHLWYRYKKGGLDREGRLMRQMLRSRRRKMEKELYPGLLRKLPRRMRNTLIAGREMITPETAPKSSRPEQKVPNNPQPVMKSQKREPFHYGQQNAQQPHLHPQNQGEKSPFDDYKQGSPFPRKTADKKGLSH